MKAMSSAVSHGHEDAGNGQQLWSEHSSSAKYNVVISAIAKGSRHVH